MPNEFQYDVFVSHSAKDKAAVRPLADRLRTDGLKVWFDEWNIKPGDSIPAKIEDGLVRINPKDARVHVVSRIDAPGRPTFVGNDVYFTGTPQLRRIRNMVLSP